MLFGQPQILLVPLQALVVEIAWWGISAALAHTASPAVPIPAGVYPGGPLAPRFAPSYATPTAQLQPFGIVSLLSIFVVYPYIWAATWGCLIDATEGVLRPFEFWSHGLRYLGRTYIALVHSFLQSLLACILALLGTLVLGFVAYHVPTINISPAGHSEVSVLSALIVAGWLIAYLWLTLRLMMLWPSVLLSVDAKAGFRIARERRSQLLFMLLCFAVMGAILCVLSLAGLAVNLAFAAAQLLPVIANAIGGISARVPSGLLAAGWGLDLASDVLWAAFLTVGALTTLLFYRAAASEEGIPVSLLGASRDLPTKHVIPLMARSGGWFREGIAAALIEVRRFLGFLRPVASRATAEFMSLMPDFGPLMKGVILRQVPAMLAANEQSVCAWETELSAQAARAIPAIEFAMLGSAAMITPWGRPWEGFLGALVGFLFGVAAARSVAVLARALLSRENLPVSSEAAEKYVAAACVAPCLWAALVFLVAVGSWATVATRAGWILVRVFSLATVALMFPPSVSVLSAKGLGGWQGVWASAAITLAILILWMFVLHLLGALA
jgi:hypothetical protein